MDVVIKPYHALPCATEAFTINGIDADLDYFGSMGDDESYRAEPYSCACMKFTPSDLRMEEAMNKYNISKDEFEAIQERLESEMYVGSCGWCV